MRRRGLCGGFGAEIVAAASATTPGAVALGAVGLAVALLSFGWHIVADVKSKSPYSQMSRFWACLKFAQKVSCCCASVLFLLS